MSPQRHLTSFLRLLRPLCAAMACLAGLASAMDWTGWTDNTADMKVVWQTGYDLPDKTIPDMKCYRHDPKAGINGGGAMVYTRTDPKEYLFQPVALPGLKAGIVYRLRLWVRAEGMAGCNPAEPVNFGGIEFFKDNAYHSGLYFSEHIDTEEFTECAKEFTVPAGAEAFLSLCLPHNATGTLYFDNVTIEGTSEQYSSVLTWPTTLSIRPGTTDFQFQVDPAAPAGLSLSVTVTQDKTVDEQWLPLNGARQATGHWPATLKPGRATLEAVLTDTARKRILGRDRYPIHILADDIPSPLDRAGRLLVDGKPFMPICAVAVPCNDEDLRRAADVGFNSVMNYDIYDGWDIHSKDVSIVRRHMDRIYSHGLRIIFNLKDLLPNDKEPYNLEAARTLLLGLKDHPALIAWNNSDENVRIEVPKVLTLRDLANELDPSHVTWTVTCHFSDLPYYGVSGDVVGVDPYPIEHRNGDRQSIHQVASAMEAANATGLPVWVVPQMFNWGRHQEPVWDRATYEKSRAPNGEELRAMPLLAAIHGAKGFVFFAYLDWYNAVEMLVPGDGEKNLRLMKPVTAILRRLEPFLLSDNAPSTPTLREATSNVHAKAFQDNDGHRAVIVVATGGKAHGIIELEPQGQWKATFGKVRQLAPGRFVIDADAVTSDVLFATDATAEP